MSKITKKIIPVIGSIFLLTGCASAPQKASGNTAGEDMKIVSTSVAICEILDELGFDNVIGVPETSSTLPEKYAKAKTVGSPMNPDLEIIKSLSPDLVLSPKSLESSLSESYSAAGISSAFLDLSSVEGMYRAITSLGELLDCQEAAEKVNDDYKSYIKSYRNGNEDEQDILLLMAFPDGFYLVATENSYVGNLIKLAGGHNVYDSSYSGDENGFVNINPEDIVQKDPDRIFVFAHYAEEDAFKFMEKEFATNKTWQYFEAVKEGRISYLPSEYFGMSATLSWTDSLEYLSPILHGDAK